MLAPDRDGDGRQLVRQLPGPAQPGPGRPRQRPIGDVCDNCPNVPNPDQKDSNGDGIGDACDACLTSMPNPDQPDTDGDGKARCLRQLPHRENGDQKDSDGDGVGDACDKCAGDNRQDRDKDGIPDACDNCIDTPNADQKTPMATPSAMPATTASPTKTRIRKRHQRRWHRRSVPTRCRGRSRLRSGTGHVSGFKRRRLDGPARLARAPCCRTPPSPDRAQVTRRSPPRSARNIL